MCAGPVSGPKGAAGTKTDNTLGLAEIACSWADANHKPVRIQDVTGSERRGSYFV